MRFWLAGILLVGMSCLPPRSGASFADIKKQLAAQQFSGVLDGDVRFTELGTLSCGADALQVIFYEWYESSPPGRAVHSSSRVIVMEGAIYVGSYAVDDRPSLHGNELVFPYSANGKSIKCAADGALPKKVLLDGEIVSFAK